MHDKPTTCELTRSPVFLVGAQRSGTTALALALSQAFAADGGCFTVNGKLPYLLRRWCTREDLEHWHLRADELEHALRRLSVGGVGADAWLDRASTTLRAHAARAAVAHGPTAAEEEVRQICAGAYGVQPWGDKYNEYLLDLPWLDRVFPTARWIFVVREPADVVASMLSWRREKAWNPRETHAAARKWATWNERWLSFRDDPEPERIFEVGYEQLAAAGGERLSDWLGLDVAAHLSGFEIRRHGGGMNLSSDALYVRHSLAQIGLLSADPARLG